MLLFPAIDLYDHKVVRLLKGDYQKMTVYSEDPVATARGIEADGGNLDDFIPRRVGAGAFDVEDDDPAFIQG